MHYKSPYRWWDMPERYDPDFGLSFFPNPPPTFALKPPLPTHTEEHKPRYEDNFAPYAGIISQPRFHLEIRRTGKKRWSMCAVKSPGGIILRKLANFKSRAEAESALSQFFQR